MSLCPPGGRVGFPSAPGNANVWRDLATVRPTRLLAPPLLWSTLYDQYQAQIQASVPTEGRTKAEAKAKISANAAVGGRAAALVTGGAPTSHEVLRFMRNVLDGHVQESYGATEED